MWAKVLYPSLQVGAELFTSQCLTLIAGQRFVGFDNGQLRRKSPIRGKQNRLLEAA
jgi:hypothetical protein